MAADRQWLAANLGRPADATMHVNAAQPSSIKPTGDPALARIEFDSEGPEGAAIRQGWPKAPPTLARFVPIAWPQGHAPVLATHAPEGESLPRADALIVTWTVDEGHALARVLSPGYDSHPPTASSPGQPGMRYWKPYTKNYARLTADMSPSAPARQYHRLGTYWPITIGERKVVLFKSDSHFSQDGTRNLQTTPNRAVWQQLIEDCKPSWVITTGTGGGIGEQVEVGDVIASRFVTFDPGGAQPRLQEFACTTPAPDGLFATATALFAKNAQFLPDTNTRAPMIVDAATASTGIVTTQGFQYDDTANTFHLKGLGDVCEMGDAVLGEVCQALGDAAPEWVAVRNVSDPEIDSSDPDAKQLANYIYENFGRWSSVCSALVCWAIVAALA